LALFCAWWTPTWRLASIPGVLFAVSGGVALALALRPPVQISAEAITIGARRIPWSSIRRVDRGGWVAPLVLHLTLANGERLRLFYSGDIASCRLLSEAILRRSCRALLDGVAHTEVFGRQSPVAEPSTASAPPRYRLLTEEDEAEVERLYQRLRTAGRLDPDK
jgi:hypothetical protein